MKVLNITHISDTHTKHHQLTNDLPGGDLIIHSGDISSMGRPHEIRLFCEWFSSLPYTNKIFIAGNHDWGFETSTEEHMEIVNEFEGVTYLQDDFIIIEGIKIYGTPYQPEFCNWAFNLPRFGDSLENKWGEIPEDVDILITHGPPHGILDDATPRNQFLGCPKLKERIEVIKPKISMFGHIHGGYGYRKIGGVFYINGSSLDESYMYTHKPIIFNWDTEINKIDFM